MQDTANIIKKTIIEYSYKNINEYYTYYIHIHIKSRDYYMTL